MKINIHAISDEGLDLDDDISADDLGLTPDDVEIEGTCYLSLRVRKLGVGFHVQGRVRARVVQTCARCLEPAPHAIEPTFQMLYQEAGTAGDRTDEELRSQDLGVSFYQSHEIDLSPEIRQALLLAMPTKPLCREDCRGLCPTCGATLNAGPCACARKDGEPAGGTLDDLLKKWGPSRRAH